jgi:hypothetical protein
VTARTQIIKEVAARLAALTTAPCDVGDVVISGDTGSAGMEDTLAAGKLLVDLYDLGDVNIVDSPTELRQNQIDEWLLEIAIDVQIPASIIGADEGDASDIASTICSTMYAAIYGPPADGGTLGGRVMAMTLRQHSGVFWTDGDRGGRLCVTGLSIVMHHRTRVGDLGTQA